MRTKKDLTRTTINSIESYIDKLISDATRNGKFEVTTNWLAPAKRKVYMDYLKTTELDVVDENSYLTISWRDIETVDEPVVVKPITYRIGDKFEHEDGDKYILACVDFNIIALINFETGNRFANAIKVDSIFIITSDNFDTITNTRPHRFTKIN